MRDNSGFRVRPGTPTLADETQGEGLRHGGLRGRFSADQAVRSHAWVRCLRRSDAGDARRDRDVDAGAARRRSSSRARSSGWAGKTESSSNGSTSSTPIRRIGLPPILPRSMRRSPTTARSRSSIASSGRYSSGSHRYHGPTLVIVTADHGESLGEHGELTHGMFAYEATLHVPLIMARVDPHSARPPDGVVIDAPVRHVDIVPTVLDLLGMERDPSLSGRSLREVVDGVSSDRPTYFESMTYNLVRGWAPLRGMLADRRKYVDLPIPELYDLRSDGKEATNLADAQRDRLLVLIESSEDLQRCAAESSRSRDRRSLGGVALTRVRSGLCSGQGVLHREGRSKTAGGDRRRSAQGDGAGAERPDRGGDREAAERHRAASVDGRCVYVTRLCLLGRRTPRAGDLHVGARAGEWRARS